MTSTDQAALPGWYDPRRPLLVFIDGPRVGAWMYADSWEEERRLAKVHGETKRTGRTLAYVVAEGPRVTHREHPTITAQAMTWTGQRVGPKRS